MCNFCLIQSVNYDAIDNELNRLHNQQLAKNPFMEGVRLPTYAKKLNIHA